MPSSSVKLIMLPVCFLLCSSWLVWSTSAGHSGLADRSVLFVSGYDSDGAGATLRRSTVLECDEISPCASLQDALRAIENDRQPWSWSHEVRTVELMAVNTTEPPCGISLFSAWCRREIEATEPYGPQLGCNSMKLNMTFSNVRIRLSPKAVGCEQAILNPGLPLQSDDTSLLKLTGVFNFALEKILLSTTGQYSLVTVHASSSITFSQCVFVIPEASNIIVARPNSSAVYIEQSHNVKFRKCTFSDRRDAYKVKEAAAGGHAVYLHQVQFSLLRIELGLGTMRTSHMDDSEVWDFASSPDQADVHLDKCVFHGKYRGAKRNHSLNDRNDAQPARTCTVNAGCQDTRGKALEVLLGDTDSSHRFVSIEDTIFQNFHSPSATTVLVQFLAADTNTTTANENNNMTLRFYNCTFSNNVALFGGGLTLEFPSTLANWHPLVRIAECMFIRNAADMEGGGLAVRSKQGEVQVWQLEITDTNFTSNKAKLYYRHTKVPGGAVSIVAGIKRLDFHLSVTGCRLKGEVPTPKPSIYMDGVSFVKNAGFGTLFTQNINLALNNMR